MEYIFIETPPYPFFIYAGEALFRPGDSHRQRTALGCFDIIFVEYGCLYMIENGNQFKVKENDVLVLHPEHTHRSYKGCDEKTYFHWLHFSTTERVTTDVELPKAFLSNKSSGYEHNKIQQKALALPVFQTLSCTVASNMFNTLKNLESLAINRYYKSSMVSKDDAFIGGTLHQQELFFKILSDLCLDNSTYSSNRVAYLVMQYLQTNYSQNISLSDMAKAVSCHPTHVIRCFKKEYHETPIKALIDIRIAKAKDLLSNTNLSCEQIAEQIGFSSASYFSKLFRDRMQISPIEFRKTFVGLKDI